MTPRRRLPYAAGWLIDEAKMGVSNAEQLLLPIVKCEPITAEIRVSISCQAILTLKTVINRLNEIRELVSEEEE
jgi:hypothetical protein